MGTPATSHERHIPLDGVRNFRDLGGYETRDGARVRWRTVFRSSSLSEASADDVQRLLDLGLRMVLDLRSHKELERNGRSALHDHRVAYRHLPFRAGSRGGSADVGRPPPVDPDTPRLDYLRGLEDAGPAIASVFAAIAHGPADGATVFHCEGGKDRTGIVAALLLRSLGVPDETIVEDYVLTREHLTNWRDLSDEQIAEMAAEYGIRLSREMLDARPETMQELLRGIDDRYGSATQFLALVGVDAEVLDSLRERLLEG